MKAQIHQYKNEYSIELIPETVEESTQFTRLTMRGNFKEATSHMNFAENGEQKLRIDIPNYKSRDNIGVSMIRNKDLKIL